MRVTRPISSLIALVLLLATASAALAQFGPGPQGGTGRNTGPFGPAPQPQTYPQQPYPPPPYPQQPYPQYPTQVQVSLVGVWSTTLYDTQGRAFASIFLQFAPDGRYQKRMIVRGGQTDIYGVWQYDAYNAVLHSRAQDYAPKNIPPSEPMGQTYSARLQWVSTNHFITQDVSGPIRWVRQQ